MKFTERHTENYKNEEKSEKNHQEGVLGRLDFIKCLLGAGVLGLGLFSSKNVEAWTKEIFEIGYEIPEKYRESVKNFFATLSKSNLNSNYLREFCPNCKIQFPEHLSDKIEIIDKNDREEGVMLIKRKGMWYAHRLFYASTYRSYYPSDVVKIDLEKNKITVIGGWHAKRLLFPFLDINDQTSLKKRDVEVDTDGYMNLFDD